MTVKLNTFAPVFLSSTSNWPWCLYEERADRKRETKTPAMLHGLTLWISDSSYKRYWGLFSKYLTDEYLPTTEEQITVQSLSVWYSASYSLSISPSQSHIVSHLVFQPHWALLHSLSHHLLSTNTSIMGKSLISIVSSPSFSLYLSLPFSFSLPFCVGEVLMGV